MSLENLMKSIKKLLPIIILTIPVVSCSSDSGKLTKKAALKMLDGFLNEQYMNMSIDLMIKGTSTRLLSVYNDEEKVITSASNADFKEIRTKEYTYIMGEGYQCYKKEDNSSYFETPTYVDFRKHIKVTGFNSKERKLNFEIDLDETVFNDTVLTYDVVNELLNEYSVEYKSIPFEVYFNDSQVYSMSMLLSDMYKDTVLKDLNLKVRFVVSKYGKELERKEFKAIGFPLVDSYDYSIAEKAILDVTQGGYGVMFNSARHTKPYIGKINDDDVVGTLSMSSISFSRNVYFKDLEYKASEDKYYVHFLGRTYLWEQDAPIVTYLAKSETIAANNISHNNAETIAYDNDNDRVLIESEGKVLVMDTNTLEVTEIVVNGDINRIIVHDEVIHVTTVTSAPESSYYNDYECYGNLYVYDRKTLELKNAYRNLNCNPYYTVIDKRGNIAISPACGGGSWMRLYHPNTGTLEVLDKVATLGGDGKLESKTYLDYDEEKDTIYAIQENTSGRSVLFFEYKNYSYTFRNTFTYKGPLLYTGSLLFPYKNHLVCEQYTYNVSDYENPVNIHADIEPNKTDFRSTKVAFASNDKIYLLKTHYYNNDPYILQVTIKDNGYSKYPFLLEGENMNFTFGFVKDGSFYLFENTLKQFFVYPFQKA